jgi:SAM-dependent methyltransferase
MTETQSNPKLVAAENYEKNVVTSITGPLTPFLLELAQPQPGEQVVDVACGTGIVARQAAPRVGAAGTVVAVDVNSAMLTVARSLPVPEGASINWREGSAQALPMPDGACDLALCQQGLQFFPDRPAAVREMYRALRPGGRIAGTVTRSLEHNPGSQLIWETIARHLKTTVAAINPAFSLGDPSDLRALLESADFTEVTMTVRSFTVREPWNAHFVAGFMPTWSALLPTVAAMNEGERAALAQAVESELVPALEKYRVGNDLLFPASFHIFLARKV